jgi:hypothetical protein
MLKGFSHEYMMPNHGPPTTDQPPENGAAAIHRGMDQRIQTPDSDTQEMPGSGAPLTLPPRFQGPPRDPLLQEPVPASDTTTTIMMEEKPPLVPQQRQLHQTMKIVLIITMLGLLLFLLLRKYKYI